MSGLLLRSQVAQQSMERRLIIILSFPLTRVADVSRAVNVGFPAMPKIARPLAGVALFRIGRASAPRERFWYTRTHGVPNQLQE